MYISSWETRRWTWIIYRWIIYVSSVTYGFMFSLFQDRLSEFESVHIFLGNQAMDLDSTVASLVYAFYSYQVCNHNTKMRVFNLWDKRVNESDVSGVDGRLAKARKALNAISGLGIRSNGLSVQRTCCTVNSRKSRPP